ncbi:DUF533 domain-containing protein [Microbulbifer hainanensis]|uniref:DUF533 domain-containing protein n=1 Tax=Microbulbifer hainanensis TaxID=2735675 RepID=UPI0018694CA3|nr:DUF533 domain-containing protein [Microbulbifer hainanensis]
MNKKLLLGALIGAGMSMLNKKLRQQPQKSPIPDIPPPDFSRVPPPDPGHGGPDNTQLDDILARAGQRRGASPGGGGATGGDIFGGAVPAGAGAGALIEIARRIFQQMQQQGAGRAGAPAGDLANILGQIFGRASGKFGQQAPAGPGGSSGGWSAASGQLFGFAESRTGAHGEEQADVMLRGMVAAAQADGRIDADEQRNIAKALEGQLDSTDLEEFKQFLTTPVDLDQVVAGVNDPATAFNLYLVSAMTINEDNPREKQYMDRLAQKLGISEQAAQVIEQQIPR